MRLVAIILVSFLCVTAAHADDQEAHYVAGRKAFDLQNFDRAIDEWKAGFEATGKPSYLYNIGLAYRAKHDYERAIFYYQRFLNETKGLRDKDVREKRELILQRIREMNDAMNGPPKDPQSPGEAVAPVPAPAPAPAPTPPPTPPAPPPPPLPSPAEAARAAEPTPHADIPPDPHPGRALRVAGIATAGAGVALLITGTFFVIAASSASSDLKAAEDQHLPWSQELSDLQASGRRDQVIAGVAFGVGAAAVVTGAVLTYLGVKRGRAAVELAPGPQALGLAIKVGF